MLQNIFQAISLMLFLWLSLKIAAPLGGLLYALFALTVKIPYLGDFFNTLLNRGVKLILIPKLLGWMVSSSGLLLGYWAYVSLFGPLSAAYEFHLLTAFALALVINIVHYLISFNLDTYSEYVVPVRDMYKQVFKDDDFDYHLSELNNHMALSRSLFVDLYLPQLFRLLFAIAFIYYALGSLGYLELKIDQSKLTLLDGIRAALTTIPLVESDQLVFHGGVWNTLNGIAKFLLFLWGVFFIAGAQSMFSDEEKVMEAFPSKEEILQAKVEAMLQGVKEQVLEQASPAESLPVKEQQRPPTDPSAEKSEPPG